MSTELRDHIKAVLESIRDKTKRAMDEGPGGEPVTLNPEEATLIYRMIFEGMGG